MSISKIDLKQISQKQSNIQEHEIQMFFMILNKYLPCFTVLGFESSRSDFSYKIKEFHNDVHIWYNHWHLQTGIDITIEFKKMITLARCRNLFPVYLFYVWMFLAVIPYKKEVNNEETSHWYSEKLINASKCFVEFEKDWNTPQFKKHKPNSMTNLWYVLDHWMK
jgi:hypothetical protein